jgi:hypothetical protein
MTIKTYADVLTPEHEMHRAYRDNGISRTPGRLLSEVLAETGGRYEVMVELPERFLADVRREAETSDDAVVAAVARTGAMSISLEHLRGHDPATTRIVYGCDFTPAEPPADAYPIKRTPSET